jgi:hypothetical protein
MAIESSASPNLAPQTEEYTIEAWLAQRQFEGQGFDELAQTLAIRLSALSNSIREKRPLFFITKYSDGATLLNDDFSSLVAEVAASLAIPLESDLTSYLDLAAFNDQAAQQIIDDDRRPLIQPVGIGAGEQPRWWLGPLWIFPRPGPVDVFKNQLAEIKL